jgi:hypothetical protein
VQKLFFCLHTTAFGVKNGVVEWLRLVCSWRVRQRRTNANGTKCKVVLF